MVLCTQNQRGVTENSWYFFLFHWTFCHFYVVSNNHTVYLVKVQRTVPLKNFIPVSCSHQPYFPGDTGIFFFQIVKALIYLCNPGWKFCVGINSLLTCLLFKKMKNAILPFLFMFLHLIITLQAWPQNPVTKALLTPLR